MAFFRHDKLRFFDLFRIIDFDLFRVLLLYLIVSRPLSYRGTTLSVTKIALLLVWLVLRMIDEVWFVLILCKLLVFNKLLTC